MCKTFLGGVLCFTLSQVGMTLCCIFINGSLKIRCRCLEMRLAKEHMVEFTRVWIWRMETLLQLNKFLWRISLKRISTLLWFDQISFRIICISFPFYCSLLPLKCLFKKIKWNIEISSFLFSSFLQLLEDLCRRL